MGASAVLGLAAVSHGHWDSPHTIDPGPARFPHQSPELVQEVVGASHRSLEKVKELVENCPPLARAAWDWGFGDWETALGAAAHTGQRDIAEYLMRRGARPDIFTFAMLGNLEAVQAMVKAQPGVQRIAGPHGIPLLRHAIAGGPQAEEVRKYLESLGDAGKEPENFPLTPEQIVSFIGTYKMDGAEDAMLVFKNVKGRLALQTGESSHIILSNHAAYEFSPAGAHEVRLTFELKDGKAVSVKGRNHTSAFSAIRVPE
jgi:hypothetical protein